MHKLRVNLNLKIAKHKYIIVYGIGLEKQEVFGIGIGFKEHISCIPIKNPDENLLKNLLKPS